jgi:SAM-dependent methyltransferase
MEIIKDSKDYLINLNTNTKLVDTFKDYSELLNNKEGLEIGGPSLFFNSSGIYTSPKKLDNVIFRESTLWSITKDNTNYIFDGKYIPGKVYISDIVDLSIIKDNAYDFVFASHILEHVVNPLKGLSEITRVLKDDGVCILILPWKEATFDHKRPISSFSKLLENYNNNRDENNIDDYLPEIKEFYDLSRDKPAGTMEQFLDRCKKHYENRALHVHVFDFDLIIKCFEHFNYEIIDTQFVKPYHQIVVGKKKI